MKKTFFILPALLLFLCLGVFIFRTVSQAPVSSAQNVTGYTFQATESGKTALEVTKKHATVELQHYDFGDMVMDINGKKADSTHFWSLSVNGTISETGASAVVLKKGDTINWKYETIQK